MAAHAAAPTVVDPLGFDLERHPAGGWAVTDRAARTGGVFATREAALAFIRQEQRVRATCALERLRFASRARSAQRTRIV